MPKEICNCSKVIKWPDIRNPATPNRYLYGKIITYHVHFSSYKWFSPKKKCMLYERESLKVKSDLFWNSMHYGIK